MESCAGCGKGIHRDEPVTAVFTQEAKRSFYHKECDEKTSHFAKWKEEAAWAFKPTRLTIDEWKHCSTRKHLGVWQSIFIARRDEDVWCPDCGLKISGNDRTRCASCGAPAIVLAAETTRMVFTHHEPLFKLLLHCTEKGEESSTYAIMSGFTPVAVTPRRKGEQTGSSTEAITLKYEPKGDPKRGFNVS